MRSEDAYNIILESIQNSFLYAALKSFPVWGRLTESTWAIVTDKTHAEIRDFLMKYIDNNDRLIVILSGKSAAWTKVLAPNEWVKNNLVL